MSVVIESGIPGVKLAHARFMKLDWWVILGLAAFPTVGTVAALVILLWQQEIGGPETPRDWQGGLPFTYHVGPGPMRVMGVFHPAGDPASRAPEPNQ